MYSTKISAGNKYDVLKPSISILIADYKVPQLKNIPKYHTKWNLREEEYKDTIITPDIELHILEIPKIQENEEIKDELVLWLKFIKNPESKEVRELMDENKYLKQAMEELGYLSSDPDFQRILEARVGFLMDVDIKESEAEKRGEKRGEVRGRAEGKTEEKKEIAKKMLSMGLTIEQIKEATNLTEEEIKNFET